MQTISQIQEKIASKSGLKTSVKRGTGSMKNYLIITPMFQNGSYPSIPFDLINELKQDLRAFDYANKPLFCSTQNICVYGIIDDRMKFKKERKQKPVNENTPQKGWGSKNSQMRLDKASSRYAKRLKNHPGCARYY